MKSANAAFAVLAVREVSRVATTPFAAVQEGTSQEFGQAKETVSNPATVPAGPAG